MGEPVSGAVAAAAVVSSEPVAPLGETVTEPVVDVESFGRVLVADGFAPGVAAAEEPGDAPVPAAGLDAGVRELPDVDGVVPAGFGFTAGGLLDELDDGLGLGDGLGAVAVAAGGALLGAPPEPKAKPMTVPGAGL